MNIKDGDIITLADGTEAIVTLTKIERVKELIPGRKYQLEYTSEYCHMVSYKSENINIDKIKEKEWYYVGTVNLYNGTSSLRYIFYSLSSIYIMFGTRNLDFVIKEIK